MQDQDLRDRIAALGFLAEIRTPAETARHLTEEAAGVAGVANGRRHRVRDQGVHRDAEDLATIDIVYLYIHCSSSYRLQTCCSARQNHIVHDVQILTRT